MNSIYINLFFYLLYSNFLFGQVENTLLRSSLEFQLKDILSLDSLSDIRKIDSCYLDAAKSEYPKNILDAIINKNNRWLFFYISNNTVLQKNYENEFDLATKGYRNGSEFNVLIDNLFIIDQTARIKYKKIIPNFFPKISTTLEVIDTCNYVLLAQYFEHDPLVLAESNLGFKRSQDLLVLLMHQCRLLSNESFQKFNTLLVNLIKQKLFNPNYYARIYDDRLLNRNDPRYPIFNELRREKINDILKFNEINKRRMEIGLEEIKN